MIAVHPAIYQSLNVRTKKKALLLLMRTNKTTNICKTRSFKRKKNHKFLKTKGNQMFISKITKANLIHALLIRNMETIIGIPSRRERTEI